MIVFQNKGLIDLDAAFTMGVNIKDTNNPIGHFGTGLKFAIATLLRDGAVVGIWRGKESIELTARPKIIRGCQVDMVWANEQQLGFTTALGKSWQPWMAFRELACNTLDEGGKYWESDNLIEDEILKGDHTTIIIAGGGIENAYLERNTIFTHGAPVYRSKRIEIRNGETNFIYYRGVRVGILEAPSKYTYNILQQIELTEDRTFKYNFQILDAIGSGLAECDHKDVLETVLKCGEKYIEHQISIPQHASHSDEFKDVSASLRKDVSTTIVANPSAMKIARIFKLSELGPESAINLPEVDQLKLDSAIETLTFAGYDIKKYDIIIVDDLGEGVYGMAKENKIFIAKVAFNKGSKEVAATLLEEWAHIETGYGDMTRSLQTWLFDQILCQIELRNNKAF